MMPETCGLIAISSRGSILPVSTVERLMSPTVGDTISYLTSLGRELRYRYTNVPMNRAPTSTQSSILKYFFIVMDM